MTGVRYLPTSIQVYAKVQGRFVSKCYPIGTDEKILADERDFLIARAKFGLIKPDAPPARLFSQDAAEYLKLVTHLTSYRDQKYAVDQWALAFKGKTRKDITSKDIRAVLEKWRVNGRKVGKGGLSVATLNRRRTVLMSLFTMLDGKSAANAVKDVPEYDESENEQIRALDPYVLARIIGRVHHLAWKSRRPQFQGKRRTASKTKARLWLMLCTGWPPAVIKRLKPEDIDWKKETVWLRRRKKGKGAKARSLPLIPGAINALRRFAQADAWGAFSTSSMHSSFDVALAAENAHRARWKHHAVDASPYTGRHVFGTELAKVITDERVIQDMMMLGNPSQVRRYTEAATADRLQQARDQLQARRKVPQKVQAVARPTTKTKRRQKTG